MNVSKIYRIAGPATLGLMVLMSLVSFFFATERIPIHWNLKGEADGFTSRIVGLSFVPGISALLWGLLCVLPKLHSAGMEFRKHNDAYYAICFSILVFLGIFQAAICLAAVAISVEMNRVIPLALAGLLLVIAPLLRGLRPNRIAGVRTPWTLSSGLAWRKTHQHAAWGFALMGLLSAVLAVWQTAVALWTVIGICTCVLIWLVVYSYLVWRSDPDALPATIHGAIVGEGDTPDAGVSE